MKIIFMEQCFLVLYLVSLYFQNIQGAHILAVLPSVWKSHYLFGRHILTQLVEQRNHTVTLISPYGTDKEEKETFSTEKFREIKVVDLLINWLEMGLSFDIEKMHEKSVMEHFTRLMYATTSNIDSMLQNSKVKELLQSPQGFNLLIVDLFLSDALLGLSFYYQIPTVVISPSGSNTWLNQRFGNPQNAALDPSNFLPYTEDMTFWQRCVNTLMAMFEKLTYSFFHMISQQAIYNKHFEPLCQHASWCKELPHHKELTENLSLALINTHPVLQYPRAFLPNMLCIAGIHLKTTKEELELPNHVEEFIREAEKGVVYMSFGANVYDFPIEKIELFLNIFKRLPEIHFIIKYDKEDDLRMISNDTSQILIKSWWPQQAILANDNVKLFITSGGFMSITEALYYEKTILAIPITPEQYVLCENLNRRNAAYVLNYNELTYDHLLFAIQHLFAHNFKNTKNVKLLKSQLLQNMDNVSPMERTLNAIEATLITGGLDYLKPHTHHLNFWSSILVDVMLILIIGLLTVIAIPFLVTSCILKRSYQNQTSLNLSNIQTHCYHCKVNDNKVLTTTATSRICADAKNLIQKRKFKNDGDIILRKGKRRFSNSDIHRKRKRLLSVRSRSSPCCYCYTTVSSSCGPTTPLPKSVDPDR